jgi:adenylate cyclase
VEAKVANRSELPLRVDKEIAALQYKSEFLVAGVQLSIVFLLSILNFITPAGFSPGVPVHSASLGLSLFTIIILLRLWLVYTDQLTSWLLGFVVVAEMALLLFIIWTYHLQYETSETINLKNPLLHFVYVLISLRALRFEPQWVLLSGFTAIVGWGLIIWLAISNEGFASFTWDFVTYASTNKIYFGAVFDELLAMLLTTLIIAFVLQRARKLLFQAVIQTSAVKDLARFFDADVVKKITGSEKQLQAGYGELRDAAILFIDLRGFSKMSKTLSPEALIDLLGEYQRLLLPIIQKNHGNIDKFIGDGIMTSFGAVVVSDTYAADALRAVDAILPAIDQWNKKRKTQGNSTIEIGIGIAIGAVVFGVIGVKDRLEYTIIGDSANVAAKLEKHNKVVGSRALATAETVSRALKQNYQEDKQRKTHKAVLVDGIPEPVDLNVLA